MKELHEFAIVWKLNHVESTNTARIYLPVDCNDSRHSSFVSRIFCLLNFAALVHSCADHLHFTFKFAELYIHNHIPSKVSLSSIVCELCRCFFGPFLDKTNKSQRLSKSNKRIRWKWTQTIFCELKNFAKSSNHEYLFYLKDCFTSSTKCTRIEQIISGCGQFSWDRLWWCWSHTDTSCILIW